MKPDVAQQVTNKMLALMLVTPMVCVLRRKRVHWLRRFCSNSLRVLQGLEPGKNRASVQRAHQCARVAGSQAFASAQITILETLKGI
jgi:hypothetical protein